VGYKLETTALISKENYNTFRIRCIMLILGKLNPEYYCEGLTGKPINILFFSYICEKITKNFQ